ncbi:MAG: amino acid permease [Acidobacteria bacterium]|nr:amino acid permease [Acidobacteriota bacterium]
MRAETQELSRSLGLFDATTIVMGSMIGSGVFIVAADIGRQVQSPGLMLTSWVVTALLTMIAALSYGELAAAMPRAGGQYIYLREAFGPLYGFLYGWTFFLVIQTGTIAAVAVAFAKFLGVFVPEVAASNKVLPFLSTQQIVAIALVVALSWVNSRGVRTGAMVQNIFTVAKTGALLGLIGAGWVLGRNETAMARNFGGDFWGGAQWGWSTVQLVGVALVGSLFSSDSWNNVTFTAGEMKNPRRNLPLSLALGVGLVSLIYIACNYVYLLVLPFDAILTAPEDRVGTAAARAIFGDGAVRMMAGAIMISTFGCVNGITLAGARVLYAMALDGLFFKAAANLDPVTKAPSTALWIQCLWAAALTLTGSYSQLLDYVIFAVLLFYILTIVGIFVLRGSKPDMERPYKAFGYPYIPAAYILLAGLVEILLLIHKPDYTWPGLIIVLLGIPVYFAWTRSRKEVKA